MRMLVKGRTTWLLLALLAWTTCTTFASTPTSETSSPSPTATIPAATSPAASELLDDPEQVLQQALELERKRSWSAAIELYDKALDRWPSRTDFSHRRRLCETHYRLVRRYQDQSFRNVLLKLPRDRALALYDELLERIETHYVDPVDLAPLLRRGLDNMEVALRDPNFLRINAGEAAPERVVWLRDVLRRQRAQLAVADRNAAQSQVLTACDLARKALNIGDAPVILEFTYGACEALDDYTSYLTPDKLNELYSMIHGNFVGLGIELKHDPEGLRLVGVIRGGPAWESGLKVGDQITHVAGRSVKGLSLDEAAGRLQGDEGSTVEITVRQADGTSRSYRIARRHVDVESVANSRIIEEATGVGYLQLTGFQETSTDELEKAIATLRSQGMRSLVLDLRGNPGGLLNVAVDIAERFIDKGVIVSTRGRAPGQSQVYRANSRAVWKMPLFVLIDHDSASASEILAGALKDHHRAVIFGERSYGKGSVQSIFALRSAPAGLKLTTAKFYSPRSRPYSEQGVEPDVAVRVAAKPAADGPIRPEGADDPVLEQAVRQAKAQLNAAR